MSKSRNGQTNLRTSPPRFHAGFSFDFERYSSFVVDCVRFSPPALALKPRSTVHFRSLSSNSGELRAVGEHFIYLVDMVGVTGSIPVAPTIEINQLHAAAN